MALAGHAPNARDKIVLDRALLMPNILKPGEIIAERYKVVSRLGAGAQGEVWRAQKRGNAGWQKIVALKVMVPSGGASDMWARAFITEARIAATLTHANIVTVNEFGTDRDGRLMFLEMPFVDGVDLYRVLSKSPRYRLPLHLIPFVGAEVLRGLDYAHRHAVTHRDVKASNVLISHEGSVQLADFGLALLAYTETSRMVVKGTFGYIAPELFDGRKATPLSDLFSFGVVLYRAITGHTLFQSEDDPLKAEMLVRAGHVPPFSDFEVKAQRELEQFVRKLLSVDPAGRPPDATRAREMLLDTRGGREATEDDLVKYLRSIGITPSTEASTHRADERSASDSAPVGPPTLTFASERTQREAPSDGVPLPLDAPGEVHSHEPTVDSDRTIRQTTTEPTVQERLASASGSSGAPKAPERTLSNRGLVAPVDPTPPPRSAERPRRRLLPILIGGAGAGVAAIGIVVVVSMGRGKGTGREEATAAPTTPPTAAADAGIAVNAETPVMATPTAPVAIDAGMVSTVEPARRGRSSRRTVRTNDDRRSEGGPEETGETTPSPTETKPPADGASRDLNRIKLPTPK